MKIASRKYNIKVFSPSKGKVMNKKAYHVGNVMGHPIMVLVEEVGLYGDTVTNAHTALVLNYKSGVYHFSGGLFTALNKADSVTSEQYQEFVKNVTFRENNPIKREV